MNELGRLLSAEQITAIRGRAMTGAVGSDDVMSLLDHLEATTLTVIVSGEAASNQQRQQALHAVSEATHGPVVILPYGWAKMDDAEVVNMLRRAHERREEL